MSFAALLGNNVAADTAKLSKIGYSGPILVAALVLYVVYVLLRVSVDRHPELPAESLRSIATVFSLAGLVALVAVILQTATDPWQAPLLMALMTIHIGLAPRVVWPELLYEGLAVGLLGLWRVVDTSWGLEGELFGMPARLVSVTVSAAFLYVSHFLLRGASSNPRIDDESFSPLTAAGLGQLAGLYLTAPTVIVAWLVKSEALAHDKNLLVALIWGVAGVAYVEVGRLLASRAWFLHGHTLLAAGTVHLFLVNFLQEGYVGPISYRLITVGIFFALLLYIYSTWRGATKRLELPANADRGRLAYLYGLVVVPAFLLLYELPRPWVVVGWAGIALVTLFLWRQGGDVHWRYAASGMAIATAIRGIASNLTFRDEILDLRTNLYVLPLACLVLLVGYEVIRRWELHTLAQESAAAQRGPWQIQVSRLAWLCSLLALVTAFIVVEASGTALTVWLSIEGLAVITLGLQARERFARLFGLLLLSFCVLKIFFYDLRGLTGLPRIFSFVVLGLVLIAVSYGYTRFKERLKELL
jgi:hypothetical protein